MKRILNPRHTYTYAPITSLAIHFFIVLFIQLAIEISAQTIEEEIILATGANEYIKIPGLTRVAVGDGSIVRVRILKEEAILMTGIKIGSTLIRAFSKDNIQHLYRLKIIDEKWMLNTDMITVSFELLEMNQEVQETLGIEWPQTLSLETAEQYLHNALLSGLNFPLAFNREKGLLNHLYQAGFAKVIANPSLTVRVGEEAWFHSGGEIPLSEGSEHSNYYVKKISWKSFGISIKVKPESVDHFHILSDLSVEISDLNRAHKIDNIPELTSRSLKTRLKSLDHQTILLGGLSKKTHNQSTEGLPWLSTIPVIGLLFSSRSSSKVETDIVLGITLYFTKPSSKNPLQYPKERMSSHMGSQTTSYE